MTTVDLVNRGSKLAEANAFFANRSAIIDKARSDLQTIVNKDYGSGAISTLIIQQLKPTVQQKIKSILDKEYEMMYNCYVLDRYITDINGRVQDLQTRKAGNRLKPFEDLVLFELKQRRASFEVAFAQRKCKDYFEAKKQKENAEILGEGFDLADVDILERSKKTQTALLIGGGVALLIGLYIALK